MVEPKKAVPMSAAATKIVQAKKVSKELVGKQVISLRHRFYSAKSEDAC